MKKGGKSKILYFQEHLAERSINKTGNKYILFKNTYGTYCLNLSVTAFDYLEEQEEIKKNYKMKLILKQWLCYFTRSSGTKKVFVQCH